MEFKEIINKVKDKHNQLKEKLDKERQKSKKDKKSAKEESLDEFNVKESSRRGHGLVDDLFTEKMDFGENKPKKSYKIEKGDSLASISEKIYGHKNNWIMIHQANYQKIQNPYELIIGMILRIPDEGEFDNFYQEYNDDGNYIVQPGDDVFSISKKVFGSKDMASKLVEWNFFKFTKDIYPGKEVKGLKYRDLEKQLQSLINKYYPEYQGKDILGEQEQIILMSIAAISRENKVPPVVMMSLSETEIYWMNYQDIGFPDDYEQYKGKEWPPMRINQQIYSQYFPDLAMDIETNVYYGIQFLKTLRKETKNWPQAIVAYNLESPLGKGKPEVQREKAKRGIKFLDLIINNMKDKERERKIKSLLNEKDEYDISYERLLKEFIDYKEFIREKYLY